MAAQNGNKNRQLSKEPLDAQIVLRVTKAEKRAWTVTARPGTLTQWMRDRLNEAALENKIINPADRAALERGPRLCGEIIPINSTPHES